ncbi:hypothetical protein V495_03940 [Pseudogymnoascus sp. VKM F-4514 (FW-929)]|nr:hypothetical protein V490_07659 [Pseudogymnoascus sp. VKM F-3557]KFY43443.1 hypothetical protein V495_03940 [Pseudogymnoascus sp. VKM F-4514 (FW-929)]
MISERELQINPLVPDSIVHNTKTLANLHNLIASLLGIAAGILGLESYPGFLFYALLTFITSALVYVFRVRPTAATEFDTTRFFVSGWTLWMGGLIDGLSGWSDEELWERDEEGLDLMMPIGTWV